MPEATAIAAPAAEASAQTWVAVPGQAAEPIGRRYAVSPWLFTNHPMGNPEPPEGYAWSLALLCGVWAIAIGLLYVACRWFAEHKRQRPDGWLRYL